MKIFKGYVKNPYRSEASIVYRYIVEEVIEFCTTYMSEVDVIVVPRSRYEGKRHIRCEGSLKRSTTSTPRTLVYFEQY